MSANSPLEIPRVTSRKSEDFSANYFSGLATAENFSGWLASAVKQPRHTVSTFSVKCNANKNLEAGSLLETCALSYLTRCQMHLEASEPKPEVVHLVASPLAAP